MTDIVSPEPPTRAHRAPAGEGERLRTQLLDVTERLLSERGSMDAVSLRQVAGEVGVTATSIYLHFADKEDLFIAVCHRRFEDLAAVLHHARSGSAAPVEQLQACIRAYVDFGLAHPVAYKVLFGTLPKSMILERVPEDELIGLQIIHEMAQIVHQGIEEGDFREVDPFACTVGLWAVSHGLVGAMDHSQDFPQLTVDGLVEVTVGMMLDGLRPRTGDA